MLSGSLLVEAQDSQADYHQNQMLLWPRRRNLPSAMVPTGHDFSAGQTAQQVRRTLDEVLRDLEELARIRAY